MKECNYQIENLTLEQARENGELISIGDSTLLRKIRYDRDIDADMLHKLLESKEEIKRNPTSKENIKLLASIQKQIEKLLFVPEVVSITISSRNHYKEMFLKGVKINGKTFRRFICGSGHARNSKVLFVEEKTSDRIKPILENGYDKEIELNPNKYNAYFALYSSNTQKVRDLKFCVVKDLQVPYQRKVDFVFQGRERSWVQPVDHFPMTLKPHDGEGLITVKGAKQWAGDLGITDYIPGFFGIREKAYVKGMLITYPIDEFIREVAGTYLFEDAWGAMRDARQYDIFLTTSQAKLWKNYRSLEEFTANCERNKLAWGVCRVAPKQNEHYGTANYQYLQTLHMKYEDIIELCQPTVDWFHKVLGGDAVHTALYLLGKGVNDIKGMEDIQNPMVKAILLNHELVNDPYIRNKINNSIKKRIQNTYSGEIVVESNYQTMIADPFSLCQHIFGFKPEDCNGLLKEGEHYSAYWNRKGVPQVDACRSPLTHYSEHNILNLQNNDLVNRWYRYQTSGIIYPTKGCDTIIHADSDFDLDIVFTTSNPVFLRCAYKNLLPVTYKKKTAPTAKITDKALFEADLLSFNNEIGVITNYSTAMYAMLEQFTVGSKAYNTLLERLKITRMLQGNAIDKSKGIEVQDFPEEWIHYQKIVHRDEYDKEGNPVRKTDTQEEKNGKRFLNKLVIDKKPYFQGWIYSKEMKQHKNYLEKAELTCKVRFDCSLEELKKKRPKTKDEKMFLQFHYKNMPLNMSPCVMNQLSWYMESIGYDIKNDVKSMNIDKIVGILKDTTIPKDEARFNKMLTLYKKFIDRKRTHVKLEQTTHFKDKFDEESYKDLKVFYDQIRNEAYKISSNSAELINYAVEIAYELHPRKGADFVWDVFLEDVLINIEKNRQEKVYLPILDPDGPIHYLGNQFRLQEVRYDL